jgi:hypothetical protein
MERETPQGRDRRFKAMKTGPKQKMDPEVAALQKDNDRLKGAPLIRILAGILDQAGARTDSALAEAL